MRFANDIPTRGSHRQFFTKNIKKYVPTFRRTPERLGNDDNNLLKYDIQEKFKCLSKNYVELILGRGSRHHYMNKTGEEQVKKNNTNYVLGGKLLKNDKGYRSKLYLIFSCF